MRNKSLVNRFAQKATRQFLRNNSTKTEELLWSELRGRKMGVKFIRQYGIEHYVVDFCCRENKLIIEVDGNIHDIQEIKDNDQARDQRLESLGYKIIRISNEEILNKLPAVITKIKKYL